MQKYFCTFFPLKWFHFYSCHFFIFLARFLLPLLPCNVYCGVMSSMLSDPLSLKIVCGLNE